MSTIKGTQTLSFGERLRAERKRLGLSQTELGAIGGVTKQSQMLYEGEKRTPDASYLACIARVGVDVAFLITGDRLGPATPAFSDAELRLVKLFRNASAPARAAALAALTASSHSPAVSQTFHGKVGQIVHGPVDQSGLVLKVGGNRGGSRKK